MAAQGTVAAIIEDIFKIKTTFQGTIVSRLAKMQLDSVVDDLNDDVLDPWAELQAEAKTEMNTPLSPFTEKELLKDTDMCMDGSAFIQQVGFAYVFVPLILSIVSLIRLRRYKHPRVTKQEVESVIASYKRLNWWP